MKNDITKLISKAERKAGLSPGSLCKKEQRLKKRISGVSTSELRRALVFVVKQQNQEITYDQLAKTIGFKRHSTVIITYRNAQNFYRQGDEKFYKALSMVVKN